MPHLSPIHWLLAIIRTTTLLLLIASILWWTQNPSFSTQNTKQTKKSTKWNWL